MTKVIVPSFSLSLDGFAAGPVQSRQDPLGKRGMELHQWFFDKKNFPAMTVATAGATSVDRKYSDRMLAGAGAFILGRNMFGPIRGNWTDEDWKGWWGDNPPWHAPTFILSHFTRDPVEMEGGTTFYFVTDGIHSTLDQARAVAGTKDVKIAGGVATIRQYLNAGLIDELHLAFVPVFLGQGESLLTGIDLPALGFDVVERAAGGHAMHVILKK
ncbi:dihydrofolate reductase family protein [Rhizobiaceae bacterium n13]|uniref:Dihydrofolate reductase family protein n=1 Tax=Ferirhizobium litorale TaxID=2927786 RepID=A0AAE3U170_9HYPH|nr:dihydrofolate reductase family protein [Fererhizobium litorale]MDI7865213.1 dihydrofolate reductase family protein [Fererhizobium litorale]MDI7922839.1 dihydrofolate reductase family protein [Fererhizobium litorale]